MDQNLYAQTKFGRYLLSRSESAYLFEKRARVSINTIYKVLKGIKPRIDVAKNIVRATKKEITLEDLGYGNTETLP